MNKKNSDIEGFDYPDLDLSDEQPPKNDKNDQQPSGEPTKKIKIDQSISKNNQVQAKSPKTSKQSVNQNQPFKTSLPFFPPPPGAPNKGAIAWMPPPPAVQKTPQPQQNYNRPQFQKNQYIQNRDNREKKNTVYVKNIPKSFNTQDKLMTFFKNQGPIKQIKVNQVDQSAVIRFVKQQNAAKFLKSNKIIFNRSYIVYGQNENLSVTHQQVSDRLNDQLGNVKKAQQTNMKVVREKVSNQLAENIRALYFFQNHLIEEESQELKNFRNELINEIQKKVEAKRYLETDNNEDFKLETYSTNSYNWSLIFIRKSNSGIDKKSLYAQFLKYGPIVTIQYECLSQKQPQIQGQNQSQQQSEEISKPILDYKIKVLFLSLKHAWIVYWARKNETGISVEGNQIQRYFDSGKLKILQLKKIPQPEPVLQHLPNESKQISQNIEPIQWPEAPQDENLGQVQKDNNGNE